MDCEKASDLMMKYMDGALTETEAVSLNRHVKACKRCEEDFLAYDSIMDNFSEMALSEPPEGFESRVMAIVRQLPAVGIKSASRSLYGVLGVFSVLLGLGVLLNMAREPLLGWMGRYPQLKPLLAVCAPVSGAIGNISLQVSAALSQVSSYLQQMGPRLYYVPLLLFGALAAAQVVIYRRERIADK